MEKQNKKVKTLNNKETFKQLNNIHKYLNKSFKGIDTARTTGCLEFEKLRFLGVASEEAVTENFSLVNEKIDELDEAIGRAFENIKKRFEENEKEVKKLKGGKK